MFKFIFLIENLLSKKKTISFQYNVYEGHKNGTHITLHYLSCLDEFDD